MKKFLPFIIFAVILIAPFKLYAQTTIGECSTAITTQGQWDDCCDNAGATNQASQSACDAFANTVNSNCSASITNQVQYDDCCGNGGGTGQASASSCNVYENANGMPAGNDGTASSASLSNSSSTTSTAGFDAVLGKINKNIVNPAIEFAFIIATVIFLWGVLQFIWNAGDQTKRQEGKDHIMWGIVGFVIMFSVYGIITLLTNTIGATGLILNQQQQTFTPPALKQIQFPSLNSSGS